MKILSAFSKEDAEKLKKSNHEVKTILDSIPSAAKAGDSYRLAEQLGLNFRK